MFTRDSVRAIFTVLKNIIHQVRRADREKAPLAIPQGGLTQNGIWKTDNSISPRLPPLVRVQHAVSNTLILGQLRRGTASEEEGVRVEGLPKVNIGSPLPHGG